MVWKKGESGNPHGKAPGKTPRGKFREQVDAALPGIVQGLVDLALNGDIAAAKIILDKCIPSLKPTADPVPLALGKDGSLSAQGQQVIAATAAGIVASDDAQAVMALLVAQSRLVEQSEIASRLDAIEAWLAGKK
jgi:hypothetical protein